MHNIQCNTNLEQYHLLYFINTNENFLKLIHNNDIDNKLEIYKILANQLNIDSQIQDIENNVVLFDYILAFWSIVINNKLLINKCQNLIDTLLYQL